MRSRRSACRCWKTDGTRPPDYSREPTGGLAHLLDHPVALYLGHTVVATPLVIILVRAGQRTTDPAIRESIIAAAVFSFLVSFDEVMIAIFVGGPSATTLPKQMWESIRFEIDPTLTAIASMLTLLAVLVLIVGELVGARKTR
jgi:ABC-type spermidine/putrescine transport system permease subunit II